MDRSPDRAIIGLCIFLSLLILGGLVVLPVVFDTQHMDDTLFLAHLGWRGANGIMPHVDYGHFYGGVTAHFMTWAQLVFGTSIKSVDYALALMALSLVGATAMIAIARLRLVTAAMLALLCIALMGTRTPLEMSPEAIGLNAAHSFVYNRYGAALAVVLAAFALFEARLRSIEWISAVGVGGLLYVLMLTKPTFVALVPCVLLTLLLQKRWLSALLACAGLLAFGLVLDAGGLRVMAAWHYALEVTSGRADIAGLIKQAIRIVLMQGLAVSLALGSLVLLLHHRGREAVPFILSAVVLCVGYVAMAATMGEFPHQQALPFLITLPLFGLTEAHRHAGERRRAAMIWPFVVILGLVGPHTLGTLGAAARGLQKSPYRLIEQGPLASYYVWGDYGPAGRAPDRPLAERRDQAAAYIADKLANEVVPDEAGQYIMLADGIALLRKIPDIEQRGIVPNGRMFEFSAALEARPVAAFPVWPTRVSPALQDITPFGAEVDVVMITRTPNIADWAMVSDLLLVKMGGQYAPCHQSLIWTLYARQDAGISGCAISP